MCKTLKAYRLHVRITGCFIVFLMRKQDIRGNGNGSATARMTKGETKGKAGEQNEV